MRLLSAKFNNYRNCGDLEVCFDSTLSFIVGENNIGKTNLINGLTHVLACRPFSKEDFFDDENPIKISFQLSLSDDEIGIFDDLIDPTTGNSIKIDAIQLNSDEYITYTHSETGESIPPHVIKQTNIISYDSLRTPKNELSFSKSKGAGAFLNRVLLEYVNGQEESFNYSPELTTALSKSLNDTLEKLVSFNRFNLNAAIESNTIDLLSKVVSIKDENNISISETGYGVQFSLLIILSLLEKISDYSKKKPAFSKDFSTILVFDEPEIHLHPFLQRTLINDLVKIAEGKDEGFNHVIKHYFGIEQMEAQIIIATHSPNMLTDDYQRIVRLYRQDGTLTASSGANLSMSQQETKHLMKQFEYIKESVYARAAIVVEGDSEYGCIEKFAQSMELSFDSLGITVIKADGAESIPPIMSLFDKLGIHAVGIIDNDKKIEKNIPDAENLFCTVTKCFDSEIVEAVFNNGNLKVLDSIIDMWDSRSTNRRFQKTKVNKIIKTYGFEHEDLQVDCSINESNETLLKQILYVTWFDINKGISVGKLIGEILPVDMIPECYKRAIIKAKECSEL